MRREIERVTGRLAGIDDQAISRLERGEIRWPRADTRRALVALLGVGSESEIGLFPKRTRRDATKDEATRRRNFLALGIAAPMLADSPRRAGAPELSEMRERFTRLQDLDNFLGGGDTFRLYFTELSRTEQILSRSLCDRSTQLALTQLAGEQAQQAGWAAFDAGFCREALDLYRYSHRAANESGNRELAANALIQIAYATGAHSAVDAADEACTTIGSDAPATARALLHSRRAWSLAATGEKDDAARALETAQSALNDNTNSAPAAKWFAWMDERELDIMTGRVWSVLGDPGKAIPPLERALAGYPDHWARDKALYMTWLADSCLDAGDADRGMAIATEALGLATRVASVRPLSRIAEITQRATELGIPGSHNLREQVATTRAPTPARL